MNDGQCRKGALKLVTQEKNKDGDGDEETAKHRGH